MVKRLKNGLPLRKRRVRVWTYNMSKMHGCWMHTEGETYLGKINPNGDIKFSVDEFFDYGEMEICMWLPYEPGSSETSMNMILDAVEVAIDENRFKKNVRPQAKKFLSKMHLQLVDSEITSEIGSEATSEIDSEITSEITSEIISVITSEITCATCMRL
jgi:hypothetical protein